MSHWLSRFAKQLFKHITTSWRLEFCFGAGRVFPHSWCKKKNKSDSLNTRATSPGEERAQFTPTTESLIHSEKGDVNKSFSGRTM